MPMKGTKNFVLDEETDDLIDELAGTESFDNRSDVVRNAVRNLAQNHEVTTE
jgi:Arc/MetJ-type ribon-helix-helix transcriptional regulator